MQRPFAIAACILFVAALTVWPAAQGLEKIPTPIDVYAAAPSAPATPGGSAAKAVVPPGSPVRLFGTTVPNGKTPALMQVKIAVKPPSGATTNLVAAMKPDGAFETTFPGSSVSGEFTVTALAPDGKATATTTFVVATPSAIGSVVDALFTELEKGTPDMNAGVSAASTSLANRGPYPEQDKVAQNLAQITAATNELTAKLKVARQGLAKLGDIAKTYPGGAGELEPITTAIATGTAEAEAARQKVVAATASVGKSSGICDRIDAVLEALSAVSLWYDVQGKLFAKVVQLATDKYLPDRIYNAAVPPAKRDNTEKFGLAENLKGIGSALTGAAESGKVGAGQGLIDFVKKPNNLALDTVQLLGSLAFDHFCEKFSGPFSGTFKVAATVNSAAFWGYTTNVVGTFTVRYEKKNPKAGEAIPITGEFEGNGSFAAYEDLMAMNNFNRQFVLYRQLFQPIGTSASVQSVVGPLGRIARMGTPGYFRVPVTGHILGTQMTIKVESALNDFSEAIKARVLYVLASPAVPLPYTMVSSLPIQKAQFILSRGVRNEVTLPIATVGAGKSMTKVISQPFDRKEVVSNGEVTVTWKLQLKACNPDCQ